MRTISTVVALSVFAVLVAAPRAQVPPVYLAGSATSTTGSELVVLAPCTFPVNVCTPSPATPTGILGGTAYDPIHQVYWHSDGALLQSVLAASSGGCDMPCTAASPVPEVTGLAFDARSSSLWILAGAPELVRTDVPRDATCPPIASRCSLANVIPAGMVSAGLALSEKRGLLFYSASLGGGVPLNFVYAASTTDPCRPLCRFDLSVAFGPTQPDPITGLAYDDCDDELFAVAGRAGVVRAKLSFPGCTIASKSLCVPPGDYRFSGLCLQPPAPVVVGTWCAPAPCPYCVTNKLRANDATLGNGGFTLSVYSAPGGGTAIPLVGVGPCGTGVAALCGKFFPALSPAPVVLPALSLVGGTCSGAAALPIPLAPDGALCGLEVCVQMLITCPAGGVGMTNALGIRIVGA